jgi:hypothetical protein
LRRRSGPLHPNPGGFELQFGTSHLGHSRSRSGARPAEGRPGHADSLIVSRHRPELRQRRLRRSQLGASVTLQPSARTGEQAHAPDTLFALELSRQLAAGSIRARHPQLTPGSLATLTATWQRNDTLYLENPLPGGGNPTAPPTLRTTGGIPCGERRHWALMKMACSGCERCARARLARSRKARKDGGGRWQRHAALGRSSEAHPASRSPEASGKAASGRRR